MKRFKLKKDTPMYLAGEEFTLGVDYHPILLNDPDTLLFTKDEEAVWRKEHIKNFDEWFEEIK